MPCEWYTSSGMPLYQPGFLIGFWSQGMTFMHRLLWALSC